MDATLKGVLGLLDGADVETRCAALLVLTRLAVDEDRAVRAVEALLQSPNVVVRDFALGYFEQVRPAAGVAALTPLLDTPEDPQRQRVVAILAAYGAAAVTAVRKLPKDGPRRRLNAIIDLCARVRSAAALDLLFAHLAGEDFDANRVACDALLAIVPALEPRARADLFARATTLAAGAKGHRSALIAAAKLLGGLGDAKARKILFAMLDAREPHVVRTHALAALVSCLRAEKLTAAEIAALLPLLDGDDEAGVLRPVVRLLEDQTLDRQYLAPLNQLAESPQPLVKRFAVQKLGSFDSAAVVKTLIGYLTDDSYARRNQATTSLKTLPAARAALMKEMLACDDERKAWTLAEILLAHDRTWKRDVLGGLWQSLQEALEKRDDRLFTAHLHFLGAVDPAWVSEQIRARAQFQRKAKRFPIAARWLALLKETSAWDDETRFAYGLAELQSHKHGLAGIARRHDPAVEVMRQLAPTAFPLAERLRRERGLTPEDLYYVAFALAEGRGEERAIARDLLEHLGTKHARTKVGKAARNKLRLVGE